MPILLIGVWTDTGKIEGENEKRPSNEIVNWLQISGTRGRIRSVGRRLPDRQSTVEAGAAPGVDANSIVN